MYEYFFTEYFWLFVGLILLGMEMIVPVFYLLWIGISALVVAAIVYVHPALSESVQIILFGALAVVTSFVNYKIRKKDAGDVDPSLENRNHEYIGSTTVLTTNINGGIGRIQLGDTTWRVTCSQSLQKGDRVKIIDTDGIGFVVSPDG